uniref:Uncharacterized protein n=1 Tax=Ananas comosus var. bracteatus TaxID=296719 RepID=A0A6V7NFV8_ANACO|nr:unnamed protein product [Ananas comosus var. bracteatus]
MRSAGRGEKILRESREKGDHNEDDDLIRLQLESLLAEKARLAHENSIYARENRFLREIVEFHQLTSMGDGVDLDDGIEEDAADVYADETLPYRDLIHRMKCLSPLYLVRALPQQHWLAPRALNLRMSISHRLSPWRQALRPAMRLCDWLCFVVCKIVCILDLTVFLEFIIRFMLLIWLIGVLLPYLCKAQSPARSLDALLQDYAFRSFHHPHTGIIYDGTVPNNLTGIKIAASRLRNGSLKKRGFANYKEFTIPTGIVVRPYVRRLVLVYQNLGNWSSFYYPLPGYTYLAPVLGLLAYDAANLSATHLPELDIVASNSPI